VKFPAIFVTQKVTPPSGHRGSPGAYESGVSRLFTGTASRLSKVANEEPAGPKGWKRGTSLSAAKIDFPSAECVVTIRRGFEAVEGMVTVSDDILAPWKFENNSLMDPGLPSKGFDSKS